MPFQGQKRRFITNFSGLLKKITPSDDIIFVDLFGGSGLLSHTAKQVCPYARVVYNDFDNYVGRLKLLDSTNKLLSDIRGLIRNYPKDKRIIGKLRTDILSVVDNHDGDIDWITLSSSLLFSMNYAKNRHDFEKSSFYNCIKKVDYNADGYLEGVEILRKDYFILFNEFKNFPNVIFFIDPPYLSTDASSYSCESYWTLRDYLNVIRTLDNKFIYFTSNKIRI